MGKRKGPKPVDPVTVRLDYLTREVEHLRQGFADLSAVVAGLRHNPPGNVTHPADGVDTGNG